MLTGLTIVFIGGDARQIQIINKCTELDATVKVVGFEQCGASSIRSIA